MSEFNVGDKVVLAKGSYWGIKTGAAGTIVDAHTLKGVSKEVVIYSVHIDNNLITCFKENLQHEAVYNSKLYKALS